MKVNGRGGGPENPRKPGFFPEKTEFPENPGKVLKRATFPKAKKGPFFVFFRVSRVFFRVY